MMAASLRTTSRDDLQAAARARIDDAIHAGRISARPSPQTIAAVADVVAAVDVVENGHKRRKVAAR